MRPRRRGKYFLPVRPPVSLSLSLISGQVPCRHDDITIPSRIHIYRANVDIGHSLVRAYIVVETRNPCPAGSIAFSRVFVMTSFSRCVTFTEQLSVRLCRILYKHVFLRRSTDGCTDAPSLISRVNFRAPPRLSRSRFPFVIPFHHADYGKNNPIDRMNAFGR